MIMYFIENNGVPFNFMLTLRNRLYMLDVCRYISYYSYSPFADNTTMTVYLLDSGPLLNKILQ